MSGWQWGLLGVVALFVALATYEAYRAGKKAGYDQGWDDCKEFGSNLDKMVMRVPYPGDQETAKKILEAVSKGIEKAAR